MIAAPSAAGRMSALHEAVATSSLQAEDVGSTAAETGRAKTRELRWRYHVAGFDLGATQSVVAVRDWDSSEPTVIPNAEGSRSTPSVVAFAADGEVLVGESARRQAAANADRTIWSITRQMGTDWSVSIDGKKYTAQQIGAFILKKLKLDAEAYAGETITEAVISVPAYFGQAERQAVREAGQIAGLHVLCVVSEPSLAAIATTGRTRVMLLCWCSTWAAVA
jgi:molecular chaperone DnaK (HSP70)